MTLRLDHVANAIGALTIKAVASYNCAVDSERMGKALRLAGAVKPIYDQHRSKIEALKSEQKHWDSQDFIWEALMISFSTWGNAKGGTLLDNGDLHDRIRYASLLGLSTDEERETVLRDCLTRGKVRWVPRKTNLLMDNFRRIEKDGGPEAIKRKLSSQQGSTAKVKFLRSFRGIGEKYARNMMMDVYHEDFRNSIAIDSRLKQVMKALGLTFDERDYADAEEFFMKAARDAGLNGWEMDRLLFSHLGEVLSSLKG